MNKNTAIAVIGILLISSAAWILIERDNGQEQNTLSEETSGNVKTNRKASSSQRDQSNTLTLNAKQLRKRYFSTNKEFDRISFLAEFEMEEPTPAQWRFFEDVAFSEKSQDVLEALLISADMSDNDQAAKQFFAKVKNEHQNEEIAEMAADLLDERD